MATADRDGSGVEDGRDPGLAEERTELAWNRSGLAVAVVVGILLRRLWPLEGVRTALALGLAAAGGVTWLVGMFLAGRSTSGPRATAPLGEDTLRLVTTGTVLLAAAGAVLSVVVPA